MPDSNTVVRPPTFDELRNNSSQVFIETESTATTQSDASHVWQEAVLHTGWINFFIFSLIFSLILLIGIIYMIIRVRQIRNAEYAFYRSQPLSSMSQRVFGIEHTSAKGSAHAARWNSVVKHMHSASTNDWKQAILDADVMLDDAITSRGYAGEGIGEKMKQVKRSDINTIDDAWEAHKMRNRIAHDGSNFELTQREARRIIGLYEGVFKELGYIEK